MHGTNESELLSACKVLFDFNVRIDRRFLEYLQTSGLKSAYRKKVFATHPDRFHSSGKSHQADRNKHFIEVKRAYESLNSYLQVRYKGFDSKKSVRRSSNRHYYNVHPRKGRSTAKNGYTKNTHRAPSRSHHHGNIPEWPLRIGEFLYYSKLILWKDMIKAVVWQKGRRERIGDIAQRWGWVSDSLILDLLKNRRQEERLGDIMLRNEIISPFKLKVLLYFQQKNQPRLGKYFINKGLLSESRLDFFLKRLDDHNKKHR